MTAGALRVGILPYAPGNNPYQSLFAQSLEDVGAVVERIEGGRWFPISRAVRRPIDLLRLDWPDSFFLGRSPLAQTTKRVMYRVGLWELRSFPLIWTVHNLVSHSARDGEAVQVQRLINCCDGLVVMSNAAETQLRETYTIASDCRVAVIPHGHYVDVYDNTVSTQDARARLDLPPQSRVVLFLGRVDPYKGVDDLIESFAKVATPQDVLVVAGRPTSDTIRRRLTELADSARGRGLDVRLALQPVPPSELQLYFNAANVVALPFRKILNSGSLLLAMSFGKCVVAPRLGSLPEVAHQESFFGYTPGAGALGGALREALDSPDLVARGVAARDFAIERYSWQKVGEANLRLCEEVLTSRA